MADLSKINEHSRIVAGLNNIELEQTQSGEQVTSTGQDDLDVGEEWQKTDKSNGLNLPKKTTRFVALSAFNFLSRHGRKCMREPMMLCQTLRQELLEEEQQSPAKSTDLNKSAILNKSSNDDRSFQKLIQRTEQNDDSVLVYDHLAHHRQKYSEARKRIQREYNTPIVQLELIEDSMEETPIKCYKYNYTLDGRPSAQSQYSSVLSISDDGETLIITTIRPNKKFNEPQYILEADEDAIKERRERHHR